MRNFKEMIKAFESLAPRRLFLFVYGAHACARVICSLMFRYGFVNSAFRWRSTDRNGNPIPWYTYPAMEYLDQLDFSDCTVFEYGVGNSTIFWAKRSLRVMAVEDDPQWMARVSPGLAESAYISLAVDKPAYIDAISMSGDAFDVIVVDGSHRLECAQAAIQRLRTGGMIILDDSDEHVAASALLRHANLLEVDFPGFGPISAYTKTTSLFFHREFRPKPREGTLPLHSLGHQSR